MKILRFKWLWAVSFLSLLAMTACLLLSVPLRTTMIPVAIAVVSMLMLFFAVIRPMQSVQHGMELLSGNDFSSRLAKVGQPDADKIVVLFNSLISSLRQERLKQEEKNILLTRLINASPMGIIMLDFDGRIADVNPGAIRLLGVGPETLPGKSVSDLAGPLGDAMRGLAMGESSTVNLSWCGGGVFRCSLLSFVDRGFRREYFMIESLTDEVRAAEKAAFSKVIRVMAHEVNNTMAGVRSALDTLSSIYEGDGADGDMQRLIRSCSSRSTALSRFVSQYAEVVKIPAPALATLNLSEWLANRMPFLESIVKGVMGDEPCTLTLQSPGNIAVNVRADSIQLEQVLVNIVKNAAESILMSRKDNPEPGKIEIILAGSPASISVIDNGVGIPPHLREELFTSFFTTKPGGHGLGLMSVAEILTSHHCRFSLLPSTPRGAAFNILFP